MKFYSYYYSMSAHSFETDGDFVYSYHLLQKYATDSLQKTLTIKAEVCAGW